MRFGELLNMCEKVFDNILIPIALTDDNLDIQWVNSEIKKRFPAMVYKNGLTEYLSYYNIDKVINLLKQGKTFSAQDHNHSLSTAQLVIFPIVDVELIGCIFILNANHQEHDFFNPGSQEKILSSFSDSYKMPLTIIFSTLGLMARNLPEDDSISRTYIKLISQNCYRLLRISNNIMDSVKFSSGFGSIKPMNGDLTAFITGLCEAAGIMTAAIGIPLKIEVPDEKVITVFDSEKLSTAILNLISNACKYTREGNKIKVKLEMTSNNAVVTVTDSGMGIQDDIINHIFERNFSYNPQGLPYNGNGMGLSIVKNIIAMHGGTIAVGSQEGKGTKVAFTLPIKTDKAVQDYTAESGMDYLADRFSAVYVELSDICGSPIP